MVVSRPPGMFCLPFVIRQAHATPELGHAQTFAIANRIRLYFAIGNVLAQIVLGKEAI